MLADGVYRLLQWSSGRWPTERSQGYFACWLDPHIQSGVLFYAYHIVETRTGGTSRDFIIPDFESNAQKSPAGSIPFTRARPSFFPKLKPTP